MSDIHTDVLFSTLFKFFCIFSFFFVFSFQLPRRALLKYESFSLCCCCYYCKSINFQSYCQVHDFNVFAMRHWKRSPETWTAHILFQFIFLHFFFGFYLESALFFRWQLSHFFLLLTFARLFCALWKHYSYLMLLLKARGSARWAASIMQILSRAFFCDRAECVQHATVVTQLQPPPLWPPWQPQRERKTLRRVRLARYMPPRVRKSRQQSHCIVVVVVWHPKRSNNKRQHLCAVFACWSLGFPPLLAHCRYSQLLISFSCCYFFFVSFLF